MRAAVLRHGGAIAVEELPAPEPGPGQVLVRPLACGVCGSDLHFVELFRSAPTDPTAPGTIMGHEFCVEVLDYGRDTREVVPVGALACSVPYATSAAGPELLGFNTSLGGAFAELMLLDAERLVAVPAGLDPVHAALTEPLAVGHHAAGLGNLEQGQAAIVVGCGPVGLAVIVSLKARGVGPVIASDFSPERRAAAEALGADIVVNPANTTPFDSWVALGQAAGLPSPLLPHGTVRAPSVTVFECVGAPGLLQQVLDGVPHGGRVVVAGVCMAPDTITPATGIYKELEVAFSFAYRPDEFASVLAELGDGRIDVDTLISGTVGLDGVADAISGLAADPNQIKVVVTP